MSRWLRLALVPALACAVVLGSALLRADPNPLEGDLKDLSSNVPATRQGAIKELSKRNARYATQLVGSLDDSAVTDVGRGSIVQVVRAIGSSGSDVSTLKALTGSSVLSVRHAAVSLLASHAAGAATELRSLLLDKSEHHAIRAAAARSVAFAGADAKEALETVAGDLEAPGSVRKAAIRGLAQASPTGAALVRKLASDKTRDRGDRLVAIKALADKHSSGPDELGELVGHPEPWVRAYACAEVARANQTKLLAEVVKRFNDPSGQVRATALQAVIDLGGETANKKGILALCRDGDARVQMTAAASVGRTYAGNAKAAKTGLKALLGSANFAVRKAGALALRAHGDKSGAATMLADQNTANAGQKIMATKAHAQITK